MGYRLLADCVLLVHFAIVLGVIVGQVLIIVGLFRHWSWVRNFWFRAAHLATILVVVGQSWAGIPCPLTIWEKQLHKLAGEATYRGDFIAHWMNQVLFYRGPDWVFTACYTLFGLLVVASFILGPPRMPWRRPRRRLARLPQITITAKMPPWPIPPSSKSSTTPRRSATTSSSTSPRSSPASVPKPATPTSAP